MTQHDKITALKGRIKNTLLKERLLLLSAGLFGILAVLTAISIILSLLAGIFVIPVWVKMALLISAGAVGLYYFWRLVITRLFMGSYESTAIKLEKRYPDLKGRLIAALEFHQITDSNKTGYSDALIGATLVQAEEQARGLNFNRVLTAYPIWKSLRAFGLAVVSAVLLLVLFPGFFSYSYKVYSNPTELVTPPLGYKLSNFSADEVAIKYRDLDIGGFLLGDKFPEAATIYYRFADGIWQKTKIGLNDKIRNPASFGDSLLFQTTLKQIRRSVDYYVAAGKLTTPIKHIDVVDRPRVTGIKLSVFYPDYTGLQPSVIDENDGNISAVVGTRVNMKIETNVPVNSAELIFGDSSRTPLEIMGQTGELSFRIDRDRSYLIHLVDNQGEVNPDPIEYYITAVADEYPVIDVVRPGVDVNLNDEMMIPLLVRISDDYGFSSLVLKYDIVSENRAGEENVAVLHFSDRIKTEGEVSFNWDVEPLNLLPSDYIRYYFEVADNDNIGGPKITKSRQYIARLPSLEEIIAETDTEYNENVDQAERYFKQHQELSERLKNIARKIEQDRAKNDNKLSWQHQKELEEIAQTDEKLAEQIKETAENIDKMINKMQENRVASRELLEKLAEIQKLFNEVATPEMREARLKMLEALKSMDPQKLDEAMKDFQSSQEEMMRRLDRTIALLKKMQIEQKVNAMTEMAKELADKQEKVNEKGESSEPKGLPELTDSEKKVREGLDKLKEEAANLRKLLGETAYQKQNEADKFCQAVEKTDAGDNMKQMEKELSDMQKNPALEQGKKSLSKLRSMLDELQKGQSGMCQGGGGDVAGLIRNAIEDINYVSDNQESLIKTATDMRGQSEVLRDLAGEQELLREMVRSLTQRIEEIGKESPFIAAELSNLMRSAASNMELSTDKLFDKRGTDAIEYQKEALFKLNRSAVRMLDALESQKQCDKGGACNKPSMKLQSMCDKQNKLNQQTQQCNNPNPNSMSAKPGEEMRRLAAEQGALRKSLMELQNEFGNSREVLGRLDAIAEDMKKVADALTEGEVGQETIDRQLKIYSRMLDASKTMQRKDFTDQRKAAVGEDVLRSSPSSLTGDQLKGGLDIEDRLRKFLDEKYPNEYEQHIRAYFKALLEQIEGN